MISFAFIFDLDSRFEILKKLTLALHCGIDPIYLSIIAIGYYGIGQYTKALIKRAPKMSSSETSQPIGGRLEIIREERVLTKNGVWMKLKGGRRTLWIALDDIGNTTVDEFRALIFDKERGVNAVATVDDVVLIYQGKKLVNNQLLSNYDLIKNESTVFFLPQHHDQ